MLGRILANKQKQTSTLEGVQDSDFFKCIFLFSIT